MGDVRITRDEYAANRGDTKGQREFVPLRIAISLFFSIPDETVTTGKEICVMRRMLSVIVCLGGSFSCLCGRDTITGQYLGCLHQSGAHECVFGGSKSLSIVRRIVTL